MSDDEPKIDYYPDGGWGMAIPPESNMTPEEALEYAKAIEKQRQGKDGE